MLLHHNSNDQPAAITGAADSLGRPSPIVSGPSVRQIRFNRSCYLRLILCLSIVVLLAASAKPTKAPSDEEQILNLEHDWVRALEGKTAKVSVS